MSKCENCGCEVMLKVYESNDVIKRVCNDCESIIFEGTCCPDCSGTGKVMGVSATVLYFDAVRSPIKMKKCDKCEGTGIVCP